MQNRIDQSNLSSSSFIQSSQAYSVLFSQLEYLPLQLTQSLFDSSFVTLENLFSVYSSSSSPEPWVPLWICQLLMFSTRFVDYLFVKISPASRQQNAFSNIDQNATNQFRTRVLQFCTKIFEFFFSQPDKLSPNHHSHAIALCNTLVVRSFVDDIYFHPSTLSKRLVDFIFRFATLLFPFSQYVFDTIVVIVEQMYESPALLGPIIFQLFSFISRILTSGNPSSIAPNGQPPNQNSPFSSNAISLSNDGRCE